MKTTKKLKLNKNTVAHLNGEKMAKVNGGYNETEAPTFCIFRSCEPFSCKFCTEMCLTKECPPFVTEFC